MVSLVGTKAEASIENHGCEDLGKGLSFSGKEERPDKVEDEGRGNHRGRGESSVNGGLAEAGMALTKRERERGKLV